MGVTACTRDIQKVQRQGCGDWYPTPFASHHAQSWKRRRFQCVAVARKGCLFLLRDPLGWLNTVAWFDKTIHVKLPSLLKQWNPLAVSGLSSGVSVQFHRPSSVDWCAVSMELYAKGATGERKCARRSRGGGGRETSYFREPKGTKALRVVYAPNTRI